MGSILDPAEETKNPVFAPDGRYIGKRYTHFIKPPRDRSRDHKLERQNKRKGRAQ